MELLNHLLWLCPADRKLIRAMQKGTAVALYVAKTVPFNKTKA